MSVHIVYKQNGVKMMRPVHTREEYLALRNGGEQQAVVQAVRQGDESRKSRLVQMNYSCLPNDDGTLKGSKRMSTTVGMDIDHLTAEGMPKVKERILQKKDELGLLMLEESARGKGYHLVFKRRADLDQVGNLKWASDLLEVAYDAKAKDITRVFFTTTEAELIYLDDTVFEIKEAADSESKSVAALQCCSSQEAVPQPSFDPEARYNGVLFTDIIAKYWELFNDGKIPVDGDRNALTFELAVTLRSICGFSLEKMMQVVPNYWAKKCTEGSVPLCTQTSNIIPQPSTIIAPSARALAAFDETLKMTELDLETLNREGVRHNTLKLLLPTLCQMMPQEELLGVLQQKMPEYSKEEDCRTLVSNFYEKYVDQNRPMNLKQKEVFLKSLKATEDSTAEPTPLCRTPTLSININQLPTGLKESLKPYPQNMWPALIVGQMPAMMALADGVSYRYCDGKTGWLGGMAIILGEQASNKSSIEEAVERWLVDLRREDQVVRDREDKVREANKRRKANERAQEPPAGVVRVVPITISCSKLLKRLKQSQGHSLYSICTEAETLIKSNGSGAWAQKWDIYRNAFGRERWGVDFNSDQSESGDVNVAYSWTLLGTPRTVMKMFKGKNESNAENGLSSRMMLSEMPDTMFAKITVFKELSETDASRISEAASLLRGASGFYDTPRLRKAIDKWLEEKRIESSLNMDVIKDRFRRRSALIGFRCGVVFMLLAGKESNACVDFAVKMAEYTLQMQMKIFAPLLTKFLHEGNDDGISTSVNGSIFEKLPSPFDLHELRRLKGNEFSENTLYSIISRWKNEGWIEKKGKGMWIKKR